MYRLFEAVLDLEAQPIQASDLVGIPMPVPLSILRSKTAEAKNFSSARASTIANAQRH